MVLHLIKACRLVDKMPELCDNAMIFQVGAREGKAARWTLHRTASYHFRSDTKATNNTKETSLPSKQKQFDRR